MSRFTQTIKKVWILTPFKSSHDMFQKAPGRGRRRLNNCASPQVPIFGKFASQQESFRSLYPPHYAHILVNVHTRFARHPTGSTGTYRILVCAILLSASLQLLLSGSLLFFRYINMTEHQSRWTTQHYTRHNRNLFENLAVPFEYY